MKNTPAGAHGVTRPTRKKYLADPRAIEVARRVVASAIARGAVTPGRPTHVSFQTLKRLKYGPRSFKQASQGGCDGLRSRHTWGADGICPHCGKTKAI